MRPNRITSHEAFSHDDLTSLAYDWERVANPNIAPKFPLKVYLPRSTEQVVEAIRETRRLGQTPRIRSNGHSSNDLVLADGGAVLTTQMLNRVLHVDAERLLARVQSGVVLAELDEHLAPQRLGLPIIGDHNHITAGGFAAVGGISPASHRHGLFIDNIEELQYVNWDGEVRTARASEGDAFRQLLAATGRYGVITELTCKLVRATKWRTIYRNDRWLFRRAEDFITVSHGLISDPENAEFERGVWIDVPVLGRSLMMGQFSTYTLAAQNAYARLRRRIAYGYLHTLGYWAGRLPRLIDMAVKYLGIIGILLSPKYGSAKDIESFSDKVLDSTVGDPSRMLVVLAPVESYAILFRRLYDLFEEVRRNERAITFIAFYVKAIHSPYLARKNGSGRYAELMPYLGVVPERMTEALLESMVSRIDDLCIEHGALRYMHTKTVKDERRQKIDPNFLYSEPPTAVTDDTRQVAASETEQMKPAGA